MPEEDDLQLKGDAGQGLGDGADGISGMEKQD